MSKTNRRMAWMPKLRAATHADRRNRRRRTRSTRDEAEIQAELQEGLVREQQERIATEREDAQMAALDEMTAQDQADGWWN